MQLTDWRPAQQKTNIIIFDKGGQTTFSLESTVDYRCLISPLLFCLVG